jgi:hypothetical protein
MSRPMLSKKSTTPTPTHGNRKHSLEASVYAKFQDALALLPQRRSSPTKPSSSAQTTPVKRSSPFSLFSSSRHKPSASAPAAVPVAGAGSSTTSFLGNKAGGTLPLQKALPMLPLPPLPTQTTKSAPSSRAVTPAAGTASKPPPLPLVSPLRTSRPTIPFATSSTLSQPTAASSARARPPITSTSRAPTLVHTRTPSKIRVEPPTPNTPLSPSKSSRTAQSPTLDMPKRSAPSPTLDPATRTSPEPLKISGPYPIRPKPGVRLPTSPPSAFPAKPPPRSLPRKRSKTFPDPSDPVTPVPPSSSSHTPTLTSSLSAAHRIIDAFELSPRHNASPEPVRATIRSKSTSPTPMSPTRPIRPTQDNAFMSIPSRARSPGSNRILPSASSIEATAARSRRENMSSPTRAAHIATSAPSGRSSVDQGLPPPPRNKPLSPTLTSSGAAAQSRRIVRPKLQPLETTPIGAQAVSRGAVKPPSPVTPETQPSSASPKTPAPYANSYIQEPPCLTSDDEGRKRRNFKSLFHRKQRPDSIVTSSSLTSAVSASGTSNAASTFGGSRHGLRSQKGPGTFGGLPEEDEMPVSTQTRHGIRRHAHAAADVPYPISFEEMVLQG